MSSSEAAIRCALIPSAELPAIVPLLLLLNPSLAEPVIRARLCEMPAQGYECVGAYAEVPAAAPAGRAGAILVGCAGLWVQTRIYVGRFLEPDNVVVHPDWRGRGVGEQLQQWIEDEARRRGCRALELNTYTANHRGQKFWFGQGYHILGYHFRKDL